MLPSVVLGLVLGVGIGLANALASLVIYRWARQRRGNGFIHAVLGGMAVRLPLTAAAAALVLVTTEAAPLAFVGALMATFVAGVLLEAVVVLRDTRLAATRRPSPSSPS